MNSQQFLFLNFLILIAFALFFYIGRPKPKQGIKLNLKDFAKNNIDSLTSDIDPKTLENAKEVGLELVKDLNARKTQAEFKSPMPVNFKKLNFMESGAVYFVYNGHEWEAHEVLGLTRGVDLAKATSHYQKLILTTDPSAFEFYDLAYAALLQSKSK